MTMLTRTQVNHFRTLTSPAYFDKLTHVKKLAVQRALLALIAHADALHAASQNTQTAGEKDRCAEAAAAGAGSAGQGVAHSESESRSNGRSGAGERAHNPASPARGPRVYAVLVAGHKLEGILPDNEVPLLSDLLYGSATGEPCYQADWHRIPECQQWMIVNRLLGVHETTLDRRLEEFRRFHRQGYLSVRRTSVAALRRLKGSKR